MTVGRAAVAACAPVVHIGDELRRKIATVRPTMTDLITGKEAPLGQADISEVIRYAYRLGAEEVCREGFRRSHGHALTAERPQRTVAELSLALRLCALPGSAVLAVDPGDR